MRFTLQQFHQLGVYRRLSLSQIINIMICNRAMTLKPLVSNASVLYRFSRCILTPYLTDLLVSKTFCKALTAGTTLEEANSISEHFRNDKISIILDFCAEGDKESGESQVKNDQNAAMFSKSAATLSSYKNQMTSIKMTGIVKVPLLMKLNQSVQIRDDFWKNNSLNGSLTGPRALQAFQQIYPQINEKIFQKYLKQIHHFSGSIQQFKIDEVDFKMNHYPFYIDQENKNDNEIIKMMFQKTDSQKKALENFKKRIFSIVDPHAKNQNGFKILIDAQQSYIQKAIEVVSEQLQNKYNKEKVYIIPTIQNYLKSSVSRSLYQIEIAKRRQLKFGAKLVRGAYLVQQTKLSKQNGTQNPIVDNFEQTTKNYLESFRLMASEFEEGQIIVATHNFETVEDTAAIAKQIDTKVKISYAQLLGLADHLTYKTNSEGFQVYKYLPWASTKTMIPYMIRRAEELSQMKYPLDDQYQLLKLELKNRIF